MTTNSEISKKSKFLTFIEIVLSFVFIYLIGESLIYLMPIKYFAYFCLAASIIIALRTNLLILPILFVTYLSLYMVIIEYKFYFLTYLISAFIYIFIIKTKYFKSKYKDFLENIFS